MRARISVLAWASGDRASNSSLACKYTHALFAHKERDDISISSCPLAYPQLCFRRSPLQLLGC